MPLGPGARLGPYEIVSRLGAGGMGNSGARSTARWSQPSCVSSDGEKLLLLVPVEDWLQAPLTVIVDWTEALPKR